MNKIKKILIENKFITTSKQIYNIELLKAQYGIKTYSVTLDKRKIIAKIQNRESQKLNLYEQMNADLKENKLFHIDILFKNEDIVLLEHIEHNSLKLKPQHQQQLAISLAELHSKEHSHYGYQYNTFFGNQIQNNKKSKSWSYFFLEQRYIENLNKIIQKIKIPEVFEQKMLNFVELISSLKYEPKKPSLIHGDIWRENILVRGDEVIKVIDPALFYADPDFELAYISMNGTLNKSFFEIYNSYRKIDDEFWEFKRYLYQIIPQMQYALIDGVSYLYEVNKTIDYLREVVGMKPEYI